MAYVHGFEHDVFISYSHANNHHEWVTRFHESLAARLIERVGRTIDVFRDPDLSKNQGLTPQLQRRVERSAVFVAVASHSYLKSDWCKQELRTFREAAGKSGIDGRVFAVWYDDVATGIGWRWPAS